MGIMMIIQLMVQIENTFFPLPGDTQHNFNFITAFHSHRNKSEPSFSSGLSIEDPNGVRRSGVNVFLVHRDTGVADSVSDFERRSFNVHLNANDDRRFLEESSLRRTSFKVAFGHLGVEVSPSALDVALEAEDGARLSDDGMREGEGERTGCAAVGWTGRKWS
ncbi:hypothetical protein BT69DRAFT_758278 [Atractiella rhizophila]|nr:hypothetical protein BT69DRAFT_758278 [Atractiella rhizophila]